MMNCRLIAVSNIIVCCAFLLSLSIPVARSQLAQPPLPSYSVYGQIVNDCNYDATVYIDYTTYSSLSYYEQVDVYSGGGYTDFLLCDGSIFDCTGGYEAYNYPFSFTYAFPYSSTPQQLYSINAPFTIVSPMYSDVVTSVGLQCPPATPTPVGQYSVYAKITNPCPSDASVTIQYTQVDGTPYSDQVDLSSAGGYQQFTLCDGTQFDCSGTSYSYSYSYTFSSSSTVHTSDSNYTAPNQMNYDAVDYTSLTCYSKQALPNNPIKPAPHGSPKPKAPSPSPKSPSPSPSPKSPSPSPSPKSPNPSPSPKSPNPVPVATIPSPLPVVETPSSVPVPTIPSPTSQILVSAAPKSGSRGVGQSLVAVSLALVMTWALLN